MYLRCDWRRLQHKPLLWNKRDNFIKLSKVELIEFLEFRDAYCLLRTQKEASLYLVPVCSIIITQFMKVKTLTFQCVERYGSNYFVVPFDSNFELGFYVQQLCKVNNMIID